MRILQVQFWREGNGSLSGLLKISRTPWYPEEYIVPHPPNTVWGPEPQTIYGRLKITGPTYATEPGLIIDSSWNVFPHSGGSGGEASIRLQALYEYSPGVYGGEAYVEYVNSFGAWNSPMYSWKTGLNDHSRFEIAYGNSMSGQTNFPGISISTDGSMNICTDIDNEVLGSLFVNDIHANRIDVSRNNTGELGIHVYENTTNDYTKIYPGRIDISGSGTVTEPGLKIYSEGWDSSIHIESDYGPDISGAAGEAYILFKNNSPYLDISSQAFRVGLNDNRHFNIGLVEGLGGDWTDVGGGHQHSSIRLDTSGNVEIYKDYSA